MSNKIAYKAKNKIFGLEIGRDQNENLSVIYIF